MEQIEEVIREKSQNTDDADALMELIQTAFISKRSVQRMIEELKEAVLND